jgi:Predicted thiol oxidoreductase
MTSLKIAVLLLCTAALASSSAFTNTVAIQTVTEAPTGFDNLSNGFVSQTDHDRNREEFEKEETVAEGLGPVYTARSCASCHGHPNTGGGTQATHVQAGHLDLS